MKFIYDNKETGTFAEFEALNISDNLSEDEAIDAFMQQVKEFDDIQGVELPKDLLILLDDEEIDLFLLAAYSPEYFKAIENMIYVVKENDIIVDQHGTAYNVDYVGKKRTVITFETITGLAVFDVENKTIINGVLTTSVSG